MIIYSIIMYIVYLTKIIFIHNLKIIE